MTREESDTLARNDIDLSESQKEIFDRFTTQYRNGFGFYRAVLQAGDVHSFNIDSGKRFEDACITRAQLSVALDSIVTEVVRDEVYSEK